MNNVTALTCRTATTLHEISKVRTRLDAIVATLSTDSMTHGGMVLLQRTLEDLQLLVAGEFGQWKRGEITGTVLSRRLDQWDSQPA